MQPDDTELNGMQSNDIEIGGEGDEVSGDPDHDTESGMSGNDTLVHSAPTGDDDPSSSNHDSSPSAAGGPGGGSPSDD